MCASNVKIRGHLLHILRGEGPQRQDEPGQDILRQGGKSIALVLSRVFRRVDMAEAVGLGLETLPASLEEAVEVAKGSEFLHKFLPDELSRRYYAEALRRCEALKNAADPIEYERVHYFNAI